MTRIKFQGLVPYEPIDKLDDWGLTREQQVRGSAAAPSARAGWRPRVPKAADAALCASGRACARAAPRPAADGPLLIAACMRCA